MVWCITYARKIKHENFHPRARTQLKNRTDPNPYITAHSPKLKVDR